MCGRRDLNPHEPCGSTDFHTTSAFAAAASVRVCGLDYPFAMPFSRLGAARLVSTPSRLAPGLARDRHVTGFPEFGQFCAAGFPAGTQFLKSDASAIPPRPHGP